MSDDPICQECHSCDCDCDKKPSPPGEILATCPHCNGKIIHFKTKNGSAIVYRCEHCTCVKATSRVESELDK